MTTLTFCGNSRYRFPEVFAALTHMSRGAGALPAHTWPVYRPPSDIKVAEVSASLTPEPLCRWWPRRRACGAAGSLVEFISPHHENIMHNDKYLTLDDRLRALLRAVVDGSYSVEEARLLLRGEVIASFCRGRESKLKRPAQGR